MTAELDVSISSKKAEVGGNELIKICQQIIQAVNKVDSTLVANQLQIDKLGTAFSEEAKAIASSVNSLNSSSQKAATSTEVLNKAQEKSTARAEKYIEKLRDLIKIEAFSVQTNKELGVQSLEGAKRKAVFTAQIQNHIKATSAEGQAVDRLVRQLRNLKVTNEELNSSQESADKRSAFSNSLSQEADILARVNARASELGVKTSELTAYKQFLAQATKLNIDLNSEEFASLQKLYLAKEQQIRIGRTIGVPVTSAPISARTSLMGNAPSAFTTTQSALNDEIVKTEQLIRLNAKYGSNIAELAIQKEILNQKTLAGNSLSAQEIARIEEKVRAVARNKSVIGEQELGNVRQQKVSGVIGGISDENIETQQMINLYRNYGSRAAELAVQKEILNKVNAAGGTVTDKERASIEANVRASMVKREELSKLQKQYEGTTESVGRMSTGLTRMQLILSGMVYMGLSRAVGSVADFYTNLSVANAVTEASVSEMQQLERSARDLGKTTAYTAGQAADGIQFLGQSGMAVRDILKTLPDALNLASAGSIDLGRSAEIATNMMASFGLKAGEFGKAADVIAYAAAKSNTNVEQLAEGMKYAGPAARAAGMSLGETAAVLGVLSNAGIQASMGGTSLRQALIQLSRSPTKNAEKALKELGLTTGDVSLEFNTFYEAMTKLSRSGMGLEQAAAIFDTRAATAMLALTKMLPQLSNLDKGIKNATGTAEKMAKIRLDNLTGDFRLLSSATEELILTLGDAGFLKALRDIVVSGKDAAIFATDLVQSWNSLWDATDKTTEGLERSHEASVIAMTSMTRLAGGIGTVTFNLNASHRSLLKASDYMAAVNDTASNLGKSLALVVAIKLGYWALDAATGIGALAARFMELAAAEGAIATASVAMRAGLSATASVFGGILALAFGTKVAWDIGKIANETIAATDQVKKLNLELGEMAKRSKSASESFIKLTADQYADMFKGLELSGIYATAKITANDPVPKELLKDWQKIGDEIERLQKIPALSLIEVDQLERLSAVYNFMGPMVKSLRLAGGTLNSEFDAALHKATLTANAYQNVAMAMVGGLYVANNFGGATPRDFKPEDDGGGEDKAKSYASFVKNLERAAKEQRELNRLRKEFGENEDLINLKLKIYNTLLEANDIKGKLSAAEEKRIQQIINETTEYENRNKSLKSFVDLQKEVVDSVELAKQAIKFGSESKEFYVEKQMQDFLKSNTNLEPKEKISARGLFATQFQAEKDLKTTKSGEEEEKKKKEEADKAYQKYLGDIERDIKVTTRKMELTGEFSRNQDLLNMKMKDYEQELKIIAELERMEIDRSSERGKEIERQIKIRDKATEAYDKERDRIKRVVDVNKELATTFVEAVKSANSFRDAVIKLGNAAEELVWKIVANQAVESLFGVLMKGAGGGGISANTIASPMTGSKSDFSALSPVLNSRASISASVSPSIRMSAMDSGVRAPASSASSGSSVSMVNQFSIKVEGGSKEQNENAANQVSASIERVVRNIVYDVILKEKAVGGALRK